MYTKQCIALPGLFNLVSGFSCVYAKIMFGAFYGVFTSDIVPLVL